MILLKKYIPKITYEEYLKILKLVEDSDLVSYFKKI